MANKVICANSIDYSTVEGSRILPFRFTLDLEESVLYPDAGQQQRFCYLIEGVGQNTSLYADLSHFLFGICETITEADIAGITVSVNGDPQDVVWRENVEIKTEEHPDNPTGCVGLKFDFPLDKVVGVMRVCITLNKTYAVGAMNVCIFGGNVTATGLSICGPACGEEMPCDSTFYQTETVCVPVTVTPYATPGEARANCCGSPIINPDNQCAGTRQSCSFTIQQRLCIEIPISFGAVIETGDAVVSCGEVSEEPCDCSTDETVSESVPETAGGAAPQTVSGAAPDILPRRDAAEDEILRGRRYFGR